MTKRRDPKNRSASRKLLIAPVAVVVLLATPAFARSGGVDASFGKHGVSTIADFGGFDGARSIAVAPNATIAVAGTRYLNAHGIARSDVVVARYTARGTLDRSFSRDGKDVFDTGRAEDARAVAITADGGVIVAGTSRSAAEAADARISLWRWTRGGSKDVRFGDGGAVGPIPSLPAAFSHTAAGIVALPDGSVVVGGTIFSELGVPTSGLPLLDEQLPQDPCRAQFVLARVDTSGKLDPAFGTRGIATTPLTGSCDVMTALTRQPDGKIVATGMHAVGGKAGVLIARFLTNGLPDPTFGIAGQSRPIPTGWETGRAVTIAPDGDIVVAATRANAYWFSISDRIVVQRYTAAGAPEQTFGSAGVVPTAYDGRVGGVVVQRNGRIIVAGEEGGCAFIFCTWNPLTFALRPNGSADRGFATSGTVRFPNRIYDATGIALQLDRPVVAGNQFPVCYWPCLLLLSDRGPANLAVVRLHP